MNIVKLMKARMKWDLEDVEMIHNVKEKEDARDTSVSVLVDVEMKISSAS